ncbi:hypothetical protein [Micromonospora sp. NPDC126480]|uniref:hypothetical protein n=1 Tax=Micromonospora sp. NPDC126480 TaxID=3155312 RepID=UPI00332C0E3B
MSADNAADAAVARADTPADPTTDDGRVRSVSVTVGSHLADRPPAALGLCEDLVAGSPTLAHLARYTSGTCDFAVDADGPGPSVAERQLIGRDVVYAMVALDAQLRGARSGDLVRLLLHTERGALIGLAVLREQYLIALTWPDTALGAPDEAVEAVRHTDAALSALANQLRRAVSQRPADYGGWLELTDAERAAIVRSAPAATRSSLDAGGLPARTWALNDTVESLTAVCRQYLSVDGLHFAAVCRPGEVLATADVLDDPRLVAFFDGTSPEARRNFYAALGRRADVQLRTLIRAAHPAVGAEVRRLVLDVEQGEIYCLPLAAEHYLIAATLDQHRVRAAEEQALALGRALP